MRNGHRIQNMRFALELYIEFTMGYWDPDLFWTQAYLDPGYLDPGLFGPRAYFDPDLCQYEFVGARTYAAYHSQARGLDKPGRKRQWTPADTVVLSDL